MGKSDAFASYPTLAGGSELGIVAFWFEHAVYLWNHIPRKDIKLSPIELFTGAKSGNVAAHLARMHVWGCPTYGLDPKLQNGDGLPKWDPCVRRGVFLGYSDQHSSTVGLILNLETGYVTTQYYCVYNDLYTTQIKRFVRAYSTNSTYKA
jgi:hypothetical protein